MAAGCTPSSSSLLLNIASINYIERFITFTFYLMNLWSLFTLLGLFLFLNNYWSFRSTLSFVYSLYYSFFNPSRILCVGIFHSYFHALFLKLVYSLHWLHSYHPYRLHLYTNHSLPWFIFWLHHNCLNHLHWWDYLSAIDLNRCAFIHFRHHRAQSYW